MRKFINLVILFMLIGTWSCVVSHNRANDPYEISKSAIEKQLNAGSETSLYLQLLSRFIKLDTTLSENEMKLIYYGQMVQPGFSGYSQQPQFSEVYENIHNKKYENALVQIDSILTNAPLNLTANYLKAYLVSETDPDLTATRQRIKVINKLYDAILSTGDGQDEKNAIDVVSVSDEYFICYNLLLTGDVQSQELINSKKRIYDKLTVEPNKNYKNKEVWFDITNIFGIF
jgi:hypothetical protein